MGLGYHGQVPFIFFKKGDEISNYVTTDYPARTEV